MLPDARLRPRPSPLRSRNMQLLLFSGLLIVISSWLVNGLMAASVAALGLLRPHSRYFREPTTPTRYNALESTVPDTNISSGTGFGTRPLAPQAATRRW